jgi:hypothetical protein
VLTHPTRSERLPCGLGHEPKQRALYATAQRAQRLAERDQRLAAGQHPGNTDGRYHAACTHAQRWGLDMPPGRWTAS